MMVVIVPVVLVFGDDGEIDDGSMVVVMVFMVFCSITEWFYTSAHRRPLWQY